MDDHILRKSREKGCLLHFAQIGFGPCPAHNPAVHRTAKTWRFPLPVTVNVMLSIIGTFEKAEKPMTSKCNLA